jgi:sugar phosphate isomerase/epimerase
MIAERFESCLHQVRHGPSLTASGLNVDFGPFEDPLGPLFRKRFDAICRFAKALTVAVITIPASTSGTPFDAEVERLTNLSALAMREGLVLTIETDRSTLTANPSLTAALCQAVPGLALTLDPSQYVVGGHSEKDVDALYAFAQNVLLRDTGKDPETGFQVRIGQGQIDYSRVVNLLERSRYDRALTVAIYDSIDGPFDTEVEVRKLKLLLESLL